jgi:putative ABC transport system substrate-binding protein
MIRRREFITLLGGAAAAWPLAARAQQAAVPVVGFVDDSLSLPYADSVRAFRLGMKAAGFTEGQNVAIEYRWAEGRNERLPALTADLVDRNVSVIVATTTPAAVAAKAATKTIPIVFFVAGDPVELGLVQSLNRPGGNLTGATTLTLEVGQKRLELLHEMVPRANIIALLVNPTSPNLAEAQSKDLQTAADKLGLQLHVLRASSEGEFDTVFSRVAQLHAGGLVISSDSFFFSRSEQLATLAARHSLPAIYGFRESAMLGGLMSYGGSLVETHRWIGVYAARILKGEKPPDLPVQQSTRLELIINLKAATALGLEIPPTLIVGADEVIE